MGFLNAPVPRVTIYSHLGDRKYIVGGGGEEEGGSTNWTDQRWRRHLHVLPMNLSLWFNNNQAGNIFCHTKMSADI
jgi:hypothetical protein